MALVHEYVKIAFSLEAWRKCLFQFLNKSLNVAFRIDLPLATKFMNK